MRKVHHRRVPSRAGRLPGGTAIGATRITVLSKDEIEIVHEATLDLLEQVGVLVREERAAALLGDAGAERVANGDVFRIPRSLVREAVAATPKRWTWHARSKEHDLRIGEGDRTRLGPGSSCTHILDFETGALRTPTAEDGDRLVRLMDALEYVDINYTPVSTGGEEGTNYSEVATLVRDLQNTSKVPVGPSFNGSMARDGLAVMKALAGGEEELRRKPMLAGYCDPVGPLIHDRAMTEVLVEYAALGQPVFVTCLDLAGASAPGSLAGTLVQQNAEVLSGLVIAHLVNPRAPLIYGCVSGILDMRVGNAALGGPEFGLLSAASAQLAHFYGLPCSTGGQSDARTHDAQASVEKGMSLLASVLAGAEFVDLYFGSYEGYGTTSLEQVILDHDIAGYAFRYAEGIDVRDETLALGLLGEVGAGGNFLGNKRSLEYTMARMSEEFYLPSVFDRRGNTTVAPRKSLLEEAHDRAARILREHRPEPLDPQVLRSMHEILDGIRRRPGAS